MSQRSWTAYCVPTEHRRVNDFVGLLLLTLAILLALSLVSFNPDDPSFNISRNPQFETKATNFAGVVGSHLAILSSRPWAFPAFSFRSFSASLPFIGSRRG